jgi:hypothetical protein
MSIKYDTNGRATIRESRQLSGMFFEFMELNQFPFDSQVLRHSYVACYHFAMCLHPSLIARQMNVKHQAIFIYLFKLTGYTEQKTASNTLPETKLTKTYMKTVAYR